MTGAGGQCAAARCCSRSRRKMASAPPVAGPWARLPLRPGTCVCYQSESENEGQMQEICQQDVQYST